MSHIPSTSAEWLPIAMAPPDEELEVSVMDFDGIVLKLPYPCRRSGTELLDASNRRRLDIQPTHWRKWTESR